MLCYLPCHISSEPSVRVFLWMQGTKPCSTLVFLSQTSVFAGRFAKVSLKGNGITDHPQMGSAGFAGTKWAVQHLWSAWPVLPPSAWGFTGGLTTNMTLTNTNVFVKTVLFPKSQIIFMSSFFCVCVYVNKTQTFQAYICTMRKTGP